MIEDMLERLVRDKIRMLSLTDKLTGFLVKKKKRGTFQAMEESRELEKELTDTVVQYLKEWMTNETFDGFIKKELDKELNSQIKLELSGKGFNKIEF